MGGHDRTKRITALKGAAGDFIDTIAEQNEGLPAERQHKVAIVKFAGKKSISVGNGTYRSNGYTYNYSQEMCIRDSHWHCLSTLGALGNDGL